MGSQHQIEINRLSRKKKQGQNGREKKSTDPKEFNFLEFLNRDISFGNGQLSDRRKEEFYLEFSSLLLSEVDIRMAFELVLIDIKDKRNNQLFLEIKESVIKGMSLSEALSKSKKFSNYEIQSIRIGEETGKLGMILNELAQYYKSKISQRRKIISALSYPCIVLFTSFAAIFFMLKFVVPMFSDVFKRFGGELPWITSTIVKLSALINKGFWPFTLFLLAIILFIRLNSKKEWYRKRSSKLLLKIPIIGELIQKIHLARFSGTMKLLIGTNTPLLQAVNLVQQMSKFYPINESLKEVEQLITLGSSFHGSLDKFSIYPKKMVQLVKVGEEVNRLDYFFEKIAQQYTEEIEYKTSTLSTVIEPLIIIFLGMVVGLILIAMYLPMFQMSNSF